MVAVLCSVESRLCACEFARHDGDANLRHSQKSLALCVEEPLQFRVSSPLQSRRCFKCYAFRLVLLSANPLPGIMFSFGKSSPSRDLLCTMEARVHRVPQSQAISLMAEWSTGAKLLLVSR